MNRTLKRTTSLNCKRDGGIGKLLIKPQLHHTGLHRSEAIFVPNWAVVYIPLP